MHDVSAQAPAPAGLVPLDHIPGTAEPTELTRALLKALDRPPLPLVTPGLFAMLVTGLLTAGLLPAVWLARKWLHTLRWHRYVVWHLAEWASINLGPEAARRLHAANSSQASLWLARGAMAMAIVAAGVAVGFVVAGVGLRPLWFPAWAWRPDLLYMLCLSGSLVLTWLAVNVHVSGQRRLLAALEESVPPAARLPVRRLPRLELGLRPIPLITGLLLFFAGMLWFLPLMIAAAAQRRVVRVHHAQVRYQLAGQMRSVLAHRRPVMVLPPTVGRVQVCRNAVCDQPLPLQARFCPRCGLPQKPISQFME